MKHYLSLFMLFAIAPLWAQGDKEVYWAELSTTENSMTLGPLTNLSQNPGYDNQPSFWSEEVLIYTATRNEQTDILTQNLNSGIKQWKSATSQGSEYSPLRIPQTEEFSAIRLDTTGLQRLYRYDAKGASQLLFTDLKVGYQLWLSATTLVCTVLVADGMDLYLADPQNGKATRIAQNVGRSLHKLPQTNATSFIQREGEIATIRTYDPQSQKKKTLVVLPSGVQDMAWLPSGELLFGKGSTLYGQFPGKEAVIRNTFPSASIQNISRIAVSPSGKRIALVGEE